MFVGAANSSTPVLPTEQSRQGAVEALGFAFHPRIRLACDQGPLRLVAALLATKNYEQGLPRLLDLAHHQYTNLR